MRSYEEIVRLIADYLDRENIPYMFVGAMSVNAWGTPRTSQDIDLMLLLGDKVKGFVGFLRKNNFSASVEDVETALGEKSHFTVFDNDSQYNIDAKGLYSEFDKRTFKRRKPVEVFGEGIWVSAPEDTIIIKLQFGSDQDLRDARSILVRQMGKLDENYLRKGIEELNLQKQFEKIRVK